MIRLILMEIIAVYFLPYRTRGVVIILSAQHFDSRRFFMFCYPSPRGRDESYIMRCFGLLNKKDRRPEPAVFFAAGVTWLNSGATSTEKAFEL